MMFVPYARQAEAWTGIRDNDESYGWYSSGIVTKPQSEGSIGHLQTSLKATAGATRRTV